MCDIACDDKDIVQVEIQSQVGYGGVKKVLYVHINGVTVCRISKIENLEEANNVKNLRIACALTLLLHRGRWSDEDETFWLEHTGTVETSFKVLYEAIERLTQDVP